MKTQHKLWAAFAGLSFLLASLGVIATVANHRIVKSFEGGEERFRAIVMEATRLSNEAGEAESQVLAFLMAGDPVHRSQFYVSEESLRRRVSTLRQSLEGAEAMAILDEGEAALQRLSSAASRLMEEYDLSSSRGQGFSPRRSAETLRALCVAGAALRESGTKLARLNQQATIAAATNVTSYARRAHAHLDLFLLLEDRADRDRFFRRYDALQEQIAILSERMTTPEGKALLGNVTAGVAQSYAIAASLLQDYDRETRNGTWDVAAHRDHMAAFASVASGIAGDGLRLTEFQIAQEAAPGVNARKIAADLDEVVLGVTTLALILSVVLGFLIWRSMSRPVSRLSAAADLVTKGNLNIDVEVGSKDEIGRLATSFNAMVAALRGSKAELLAAKEYTEQIFKSMDDALLVVGPDGFIQWVNPSACRFLRRSEHDVVGRHITCIDTDVAPAYSIAGETASKAGAMLEGIVRQASERPARGAIELPGWPRTDLDVTAFPIESASGSCMTGLLLRDVSERVRVESAIRVSHSLLEIANAHTEVAPLLKDFAVEVKAFTGCAAVGIRIFDEEGSDLQEAYCGSSKAFIETESARCVKTDQCMCANVIKGTTDKSLPFYTPGGSFYSNSTTHLLAAISKMGNGRALGVCSRFEHESVALVPIRIGQRVRGLIHVADSRENTVPWETIQVLESAALQLGTAAGRIIAENKAVTDYLTGLFNHRHFRERLEQEVVRAHRQSQSFSLVILDVDSFKKVNDCLGHLAGDKVLKEVARVVREGLKEYDTAFRYGGDEFALILPGTGYDGAETTVQRILLLVETVVGEETARFSLRSGMSAGVATFPADAVSSQELVMMADVALFRAKQLGGNCIQRASDLGRPADREWEAFRLNSVYALAAAVDARDHNTFGHSGRVAALCVSLGYALGLPPKRVDNLSSAALLHDVGKLSVSDDVLRKVKDLTSAEWQEVKKHPEHGVRIVERIPQLAPILPAILHHHERFDGTGYPSGTRGKDIPLEARIIAIIDAYDTMTTVRSYRNGILTQAEAVAELRSCAGTQFDPELVEAFVEVLTGREGAKVDAAVSRFIAPGVSGLPQQVGRRQVRPGG